MFKAFHWPLFGFFLVSLSGCGSTGMNLHPYVDPAATPEKFYVCHGYGCTYKTWAGFSDKEWVNISRIFAKKPKNAENERENIARAIGLMEKYAGNASGTAGDLGEARTKREDEAQMDCIDETINTSLYLRFLDEAGFLVYHRTVPPVHRGYFVDGMWPHNSAAVKETATDKVYVVDSYYFANSEPARIVLLSDWVGGWRPPEILEKRNRAYGTP